MLTIYTLHWRGWQTYYRHIWGVWDNEYDDCVVNICDDDLHSSVVSDVHVKGSGRATTLRNKKKFVDKNCDISNIQRQRHDRPSSVLSNELFQSEQEVAAKIKLFKCSSIAGGAFL